MGGARLAMAAREWRVERMDRRSSAGKHILGPVVGDELRK
jgi:hypothetical protein